MRKTERIYVRMSATEHAALQRLAELERRNVCELVREIARSACMAHGTWPRTDPMTSERQAQAID